MQHLPTACPCCTTVSLSDFVPANCPATEHAAIENQRTANVQPAGSMHTIRRNLLDISWDMRNVLCSQGETACLFLRGSEGILSLLRSLVTTCQQFPASCCHDILPPLHEALRFQAPAATSFLPCFGVLRFFLPASNCQLLDILRRCVAAHKQAGLTARFLLASRTKHSLACAKIEDFCGMQDSCQKTRNCAHVEATVI